MAFYHELKLVSFWRDCITEVICTFFLLMYITFSNVTLNTELYQPQSPSTGLLLAFVVPVLIESFGNVSGCLMNPGITFGVFLKRRISFFRWLLYSGGQLLGGFAGASTVMSLTPVSLRGQIKAMQPSSLISNGQAVAVEFLITFILIYIVISTGDDHLGRPVVAYASIPIGMAVGAGIIVATTFTGASMNPAVNFSLCAVNHEFPRQWVYWAAHYPAGLVAAAVHYLAVLTKPKPQAEPATSEEPTALPPNDITSGDLDKGGAFPSGITNHAFTVDSNTSL